jgi:hypothetical protein
MKENRRKRPSSGDIIYGKYKKKKTLCVGCEGITITDVWDVEKGRVWLPRRLAFVFLYHQSVYVV